MKIPILLTILIIFASYLYTRAKGKIEASKYLSKDIQYGPFTIKVSGKKMVDKKSGMVNYTNVTFEIFHEGKPVAFPDTEKDKNGAISFNTVFALPDAPDSTLLVRYPGNHLIYLKNGVPVVEDIPNFESIQFLDSQNGQPGPQSESIWNSEVSDLEHLDHIEGGRYLLVSRNTMIDLHAHKIWEINKDNKELENYNFPSPYNAALAFSPDHKSIVFHAEFQAWRAADKDLPDSNNALVVYDFEKDSGYVVKYDDTDTRMTNRFRDIDLKWLDTYFEWKKSPEGDRLHLRQLKKLPNWTGRYNPDYNNYVLYPVKPGMLPVFLDFALAQIGWSKDSIVHDEMHNNNMTRRIMIHSGDLKFEIQYKESGQELTIEKNHQESNMNPEVGILVKKIADAFDAELLGGKHQELFGRILSEAKQRQIDIN